MPTLKSIKQEQFCQTYIKHKFNGTKAYQELHPNAQYNTSRAEAATLLVKPAIQERTKEILRENNLDINNILPSLKEEITATKSILAKPNLKEYIVPDYPTRLEAKKTLLKVAGVLNNSAPSSISTNFVHINIDPGKLDTALKRLEALNSALDITEEAQFIDRSSSQSKG